MESKQFKEVTEWQIKTFGHATALSKIAHLKQEIKELEVAINNEDKTVVLFEAIEETRMEFADCFILLFGAAASYGMTYQDIVDAINEKMRINVNRKWGNPDANGVVNHIKE